MSERCADVSLAAGEVLAATAVTAERWLLVEVPGSWPRDVGAEGALPEEAQGAVSAWLVKTPGARLQFVRRPGRVSKRRVVFVVRAQESHGEVRRIELEGLEDLASLDLDSAGAPVDTSLVLVCGHGSRDQCCALRGTAVFGALSGRLGEEELWIASHLGGHRFAANVLVLPAGLQLGRVEVSEAPYVVARALAGKIELERYRGRTCYSPTVQAGEHAVRVSAGLDGVDDVRFVDVDDDHVRFRAWDGTDWSVVVEEAEGPAVPASCGDESAPQRSFRARVL
jgi:hypothetical protein